MILAAAILLIGIAVAMTLSMRIPRAASDLRNRLSFVGLIVLAVIPWIFLPVSPIVIGAVLLFGGPIGGTIVLLIAFRGRTIDDHPLCRRCRYDLFGLDPLPDLCPECGADLKGKRRLRIGHLRWSPRLFVIGFLLIAPTLLLVLSVASRFQNGRTFHELKPTWWLRLELTSSSESTRSAAGRQFVRRMARGELSDEELTSLIEPLLGYSADASIPWHDDYALLLDRAMHKDLTTLAQEDRYLRQTVEAGIDVWLRSHINESWPARPVLTYRPSQAMRLSSASYVRERLPVVEITTRRVAVDGRRIDISRHIHCRADDHITDRLDLGLKLAPGHHEVEVQLEVHVKLFDESWLRWTMTRALSTEVLPDDQPVYSIARGAEADDAVRSLLDPYNWSEYALGPVSGYAGPLTIACDILGRADGEEVLLGSVVIPAEQRSEPDLAEPIGVSFPKHNEVDIILRSNPALLAGHAFKDPVWEGEVTGRVQISIHEDWYLYGIVRSSVSATTTTSAKGETVTITVNPLPVGLYAVVTLDTDQRNNGTSIGSLTCKRGESAVVTLPLPADAPGHYLCIRPRLYDMPPGTYRWPIRLEIERAEPVTEPTTP